jgi:hypothetical protein
MASSNMASWKLSNSIKVEFAGKIMELNDGFTIAMFDYLSASGFTTTFTMLYGR